MSYKARFAPSPTGLLHIGNARSALLNWAHIKNKGGDLILRIDDTDITRSNEDYEEKIKNNLKWLGIDWVKTFNQSNKIKIYNERAEYLKSINKIYPCFETAEELSLKRKTLLSSGKPPIYDRSALNLHQSEIKNLINKGKKPHWRFKLDDNIIEWEDLIKGKVSFDSKYLSDPILIREDGSFLYHLPSVVDDIDEEITDIIRGDDHITNTAFHIQIFKSFNKEIPSFGHHPFIVDDSGKSFGKRLNSFSIKNLIDDGYENISVINYLLSIGTSKNVSKKTNINQIIDDFEISSLSKSSLKFSPEILKNINKEIVMNYNFSDIENRYKDLDMYNLNEDFWLFIRQNINFFNESIEWHNIIFSDKVHSSSNDFLSIVAKNLPDEPYDLDTWQYWTNMVKKETGKSGKDLYMPIRKALTGKEEGPELKYLIPLLSKKHILKKLGNI